jgi:hypothetical protein
LGHLEKSQLWGLQIRGDDGELQFREHCVQLFDAIAKIRTIEHLDLSDHGFGDSTAMALVTALDHLPLLREVVFAGATLSSPSIITEFDNGIGRSPLIQAIGLSETELNPYFADLSPIASDSTGFRRAIRGHSQASTPIVRISFNLTGVDYSDGYRQFAASFPISCDLNPPAGVSQLLALNATAAKPRSIRSTDVESKFGTDSQRLVASPFEPWDKHEPKPFTLDSLVSGFADLPFRTRVANPAGTIFDRSKSLIDPLFVPLMERVDSISRVFVGFAGEGQIEPITTFAAVEEMELLRRRCAVLPPQGREETLLVRSISSGTFETTADDSESAPGGGIARSTSLAGTELVGAEAASGLIVKSRSQGLDKFAKLQTQKPPVTAKSPGKRSGRPQ